MTINKTIKLTGHFFASYFNSAVERLNHLKSLSCVVVCLWTMYLPQHNLILIKNPNYSSLPIRSAAAPHFPTRLGTLVTLPGLGYEPYVATVVAVERAMQLQGQH